MFGKLSSVWKSSILSKSTKIRIFKSNVIVVLLYGCESWRMTKGDEAKLDTFQHKCLPRLLKVYWPMRVSNEEVHRRANTETISELVRNRSWTWIGHVLRMDNSCLPRVALTWPQKGNAREEDLKKRGEGLWRKREWQWISTLGLRQDWWQQTGYLEEHDFRPYSPYGEKELMVIYYIGPCVRDFLPIKNFFQVLF